MTLKEFMVVLSCTFITALIFTGCEKKQNQPDSALETGVKSENTVNGDRISAGINQQNEQGRNEQRLKSGDKPYDNYFRNIIIDLNDLNCMRAFNDTDLDALISIVNKKTEKTVRCVYIRSKDNFLISRIPNGKYYVKLYMGNVWNKDKPLKNGEIKGGFEKNARFEKFRAVMDMKQKNKENETEYFSGEWRFFEMLNTEGSSDSMNEEEFFND